ncbi:MAG: methionyl-tRNA formyltransferase [Sediminibacterium sp.]
MKVGVIGAVGTTALTIKKLLQHGIQIGGVLGHEPKVKGKVSGLNDIKGLCAELELDYKGYTNINIPEYIDWFKSMQLDVIFAVGFSQLLKDDWLTIAKHGCIGFHPTNLPKGRGRAPIAWLILEGKSGAASFFKMGNGADDGPIYGQEPVEIDVKDEVESLVPKVQIAISNALDKLLPKLKAGCWDAIPQNDAEATFYTKRDPIDGLINWNLTALEIDRLIKATTAPYPGAFSFVRGEIIKIWKSAVADDNNIMGVVGRVLLVDENKGYLVKCGIGSLWIKSFTTIAKDGLKLGDFLGGAIPFDRFDEINKKLIS